MICKRCNSEIPNEAKICGYCGAEIVPEGVIYNGPGEDAYLPPTPEELRGKESQTETPPEYQQGAQAEPAPPDYQRGVQSAAPPINYQQGVPTPPPPMAYQQGVPTPPPPMAYQQGVPTAPPPVAYQQGVPTAPPPVAYQQGVPTAPPPMAYQQGVPTAPPPMAYQQGVPPEPSNPLLSPEYHPQGGASPQFSNGFGYSQMPFNDASVYGDGGASGMAIASLVLGILGLVIGCCLPGITMILSVIGLILGIVAVVKLEDGKGMAIGGLVCSVVAVIYAALMLLISYV